MSMSMGVERLPCPNLSTLSGTQAASGPRFAMSGALSFSYFTLLFSYKTL